MRFLLGLLTAAFLTSCSVSVPAMLVTRSGETFAGTTTEGMSSRDLVLHSDQGNTLTGSYRPRGGNRDNVFDFQISDGRTGRVLVSGVSPKSGHGMGQLSTGEDCKFIYGTAAGGRGF